MRPKLVRYTMNSTKYPISALPLVPKSQLLINNLTPDTYTPNPHAFRTKVLTETPSLQRRARVYAISHTLSVTRILIALFLQLLQGPCHFSYVSPFPVPFPYEIEPPVPSPDDKGAYIEKWLADREAVHPLPHSPSHPNASLRKYYAKNRDQTLNLIALSETGLRDCVPHLDVGDGFAILGEPGLTNEFDSEGDPQPSKIKEARDAREDLIDILSGHATLMSPPEETDEAPTSGFAPWSLRYSGHQFGSWAGQLGDGRATTIRTLFF